MCMVWQKGRYVAKRDNHPHVDVVTLAMLDLYCRLFLLEQYSDSSPIFHIFAVWDSMDLICIDACVKPLLCTMCEDTGQCHSDICQGFMLQALNIQCFGLCNHFEMNLWYIVNWGIKKNNCWWRHYVLIPLKLAGRLKLTVAIYCRASNWSGCWVTLLIF